MNNEEFEIKLKNLIKSCDKLISIFSSKTKNEKIMNEITENKDKKLMQIIHDLSAINDKLKTLKISEKRSINIITNYLIKITNNWTRFPNDENSEKETEDWKNIQNNFYKLLSKSSQSTQQSSI